MAFVHRPGSHRGSGNDLAVAIHGPVNLEGKLGVHFALADQRGIRVSGGKVSLVEFAVAFPVDRQLRQPGFEFLIVPVMLAFQGVHVYDGVIGGIGLDEARVHKDLGALNQPDWHALADNAFKEVSEGNRSPAAGGLAQDAMLGDIVIEIEIEKPEPIEPLGQGWP